MPRDTRNMLILLGALLVVFVSSIVMYRDVVSEIRVGDGHVNSFVGTQHDHMQGR